MVHTTGFCMSFAYFHALWVDYTKPCELSMRTWCVRHPHAQAPAAPAYVPPAPPAPAWAAPQPPARDNVYGPGPAEPLPTGLGGQGRQQPRPSTSSSFAASSSVTSSLGPTPAATPGGPHTSFLPPASTASTPASFSPPAPSLPALSPEQLQGGARGFLPSWAAASQGPDHEGLDVSVPGARASTATVREAQARGWDNQGLHLSTGDPDYGEFDLRGVLQELDMGLGRRPPVAGRRATGTSTGSPSPATSPTGENPPCHCLNPLATPVHVSGRKQIAPAHQILKPLVCMAFMQVILCLRLGLWQNCLLTRTQPSQPAQRPIARVCTAVGHLLHPLQQWVLRGRRSRYQAVCCQCLALAAAGLQPPPQQLQR